MTLRGEDYFLAVAEIWRVYQGGKISILKREKLLHPHRVKLAKARDKDEKEAREEYYAR